MRTVPVETMIIFDLDGTLWDSGKEVADSWNLVISSCLSSSKDASFKPLTVDDIHGVMGMNMKEISELLLPDYKGSDKQKIFKECEKFEVEYINKHGGKLYRGVPETLMKLKASGYKMAIVSNCQTGYISAFLNSMGMHDFFCDYEEWGRTLRSKAENIRLVMERNGCRKAIYIGDIQKDIDSAHSAGIPCIHAAYGFGEVKDADYIIKDFSELPSVLAQYVSGVSMRCQQGVNGDGSQCVNGDGSQCVNGDGSR